MVEVDPKKLEIAQRAAKLFLTQMAGVPTDIQLMAIEMLAGTIIKTGIKPQYQLQLVDHWLKSVRDTVLDKPKKEDRRGKKAGN